MAEQYTTKDSGQRAEFESGMVRDTSFDKPRPDLAIDGVLFWRVVGLMTRGAQKYEARNWMKAIPGDTEDDRTEEQIRAHESFARHAMQWYLINDPLFRRLYPGLVDDWEQEDHAAATAFNVNVFETIEEAKEQLRDQVLADMVGLDDYSVMVEVTGPPSKWADPGVEGQEYRERVRAGYHNLLEELRGGTDEEV